MTNDNDFLNQPPEPAHTRKALLDHMKHELRTPISAVIGYSEMLLEDIDSSGRSDLASALQKIHTAGKQLLSAVDEVLDPAKMTGERGLAWKTLEASISDGMLTPIDDVVAYSEQVLVEDATSDIGERFTADLKKIRGAGQRLHVLIDKFVDQLKTELDVPSDLSVMFREEEETILHQPTEQDGRTPEGEGGLVLVVDDNESNRDLLSRRLERQGHAVVVAENGVQALQMMEAYRFDLVLLDIMMPEMDGFQLLQRLKSHPVWRDIPVIMISAMGGIDGIVRCIELGAEDYLPKSFNPVLLKARIGACLEKKRLRDQEQAHLAQLQIAREKTERLLLNVLPEAIADKLKEGEKFIAERFEEATVLFADLFGFTELSIRIPPVELVYMLNELFSLFDNLTERYGLEKIKTIGDCYMVAGGLPTRRADHAETIAEMAIEMQQEIEQYNRAHGLTLSIRTGINTGPVVAGIIGTRKFIYDLWGDTVNTASRMESHGIPGRIQVTKGTYERLRDQYLFDERGLIEVKGKGIMTTYFLTGRKYFTAGQGQ